MTQVASTPSTGVSLEALAVGISGKWEKESAWSLSDVVGSHCLKARPAEISTGVKRLAALHWLTFRVS